MSERQWDIGRSVRRHLFLATCAAILLFGGLGGWAATTELSGAVVAAGNLVVASSVKKVQHPSGGVIGELLVRDGDAVGAGQLLIRFDETVTRANLAVVDSSLIELYARMARLIAERDGSDEVRVPRALAEYPNSEKISAVLEGEKRLFELRRNARSGQKAQLDEKTGQLLEEIEGLSGQIEGKKREMEFIERELAGVRDLWNKKLIPIQRLTALERDAARIQGEHGQLVAGVAQAKGKISETRLQIIQIDQDLRSEVAKELREIQGKVAELVEKRVAAQDQLSRIDVRSPQDGVVQQLSVHTIGGVVGPGEQMMRIVPRSDDLVVEAKIPPKEVDQITLGQKSILRFTAFNQRTTPEIEGRVSLIGADQITDEKTGTSYFKIQVTPMGAELGRLKNARLVPGMPVEAFVQTSSRTALSYLLKPMADQFAKAFREE
jgi:HlyD family secretion protein